MLVGFGAQGDLWGVTLAIWQWGETLIQPE